MAAQDIQISLEELRADKGGSIFISLFREGDGFPDNPKKASKVLQIKAINSITINNIPPGVYALALLHDLDGDKKMTYSMVGIPKDGFASSPDGGPAFSRPDFAKAKFTHAAGGTRLRLKVHYFL